MVPGTGIEPVRPLSKAAEFKSAASTYFAIRARADYGVQQPKKTSREVPIEIDLRT
jgi:hypothetical protein